MCWLKIRTVLLITGFLGIALIIINQIPWEFPVHEEILIAEDEPVILWWTPFGSEDTSRKCGKFKCHFTQDRNYWSHENLKAILFYGSDFEIEDLPIPRDPRIQWGLLHEESPRNNLVFVHEEALKLFNYSSTFSRFSDVPLTLVNLPGEAELLDKQYFTSTAEKNRLIIEENFSPILYLQSNCDTLSERDLYISELMKYIKIDAYGSCLNTKQLPKNLKENYIENLSSEELKKFGGKFKFTLAFENAVCDDYITEKLWRPLISGSVPVYYGSPSFKDWLPNNSSAIAVQDFASPKNLSDFLHQLLKNDTKYEEYLSHKLPENGISNAKLLANLRKRPPELFSIFAYYVQEFECLVCEKIHKNESRTVAKEEYNCEIPNEKFNFDKAKMANSWIDAWNMEKCTAKIVSEYLQKNKTIKASEVDGKKIRMYLNNEC